VSNNFTSSAAVPTHTLYTLTRGKVKRKDPAQPVKDANGNITDYIKVRYSSPYTFVPSPGEYKMNKYRLTPAGTVSDDSPEVFAARINTNPADLVGITAQAAAKGKVIEVSPTQNITMVNVETAIELIAAVTDTKQLDTFFVQESGNKPRVRKRVLVAVEVRRKELDDIAATQTVTGTGD